MSPSASAALVSQLLALADLPASFLGLLPSDGPFVPGHTPFAAGGLPLRAAVFDWFSF